jgi:GAF domain-containing protein
MTGYRTRSMMCHPILDGNGEVIGVAQVINKGGTGVNGDLAPFGQIDEAVVEKYLPFCGIGLRNAQLYERSQLEVKRNQVLLDLAGVIFQEQSTIDNVIHRLAAFKKIFFRIRVLKSWDSRGTRFGRTRI